MIEIKLDKAAIERATTMATNVPKLTKRAEVSAINATLTHIAAKISKTARERYVGKASNIKKSLNKKLARANDPVGKIETAGKALPLIAFKITQNKRGGPLKVKVLKAHKLEPVKGLFFNQFPKGYKGHMIRVSRARMPLRTPAGPSVPQMVGNEESVSLWKQGLEEFLERRFTSEMDRRIGNLFK